MNPYTVIFITKNKDKNSTSQCMAANRAIALLECSEYAAKNLGFETPEAAGLICVAVLDGHHFNYVEQATLEIFEVLKQASKAEKDIRSDKTTTGTH